MAGKILNVKVFENDKKEWKELAKEMNVVEVGASETEVFRAFLRKVKEMVEKRN